MTMQWAVFESHVQLFEPQYKSIGVDELLISCINCYYRLLLSNPIISFHNYDKILAKFLLRCNDQSELGLVWIAPAWLFLVASWKQMQS